MSRRRLISLITIVAFVGLASSGGGTALASSTGGVTRLMGHVLPALSQATQLPAGVASTSGNDPLTL
ncbi:MAG: hypothetical protein ACYDCQ_13175, partial [Dehalococcoidia bacterium]